MSSFVKLAILGISLTAGLMFLSFNYTLVSAFLVGVGAAHIGMSVAEYFIER